MSQVVEILTNSSTLINTPAKSLMPNSATTSLSPHVQHIELTDLPDVKAAANSSKLLQSLNPLHQVKATLQVCVGTATLTVGELMAAKEQQVVVLDRNIEQPVDLMLEGQVVARGQLVAVDDHFAVRITALPLALSLAKPAAI